MRYQAVDSHLSRFLASDSSLQKLDIAAAARPITPGPKQCCDSQLISVPTVSSLEASLVAPDRVGIQPASSTRQTTMPSNDTVFICSCNERLETTDDVDLHDLSWFGLGHDKQCRYPGCTTISPQTSNAKRHWRTHLPDRLGKYFCRKCDASYVKPEALRKHEAAAVCRKNRKRCRSAPEQDAAPSSPPAIRRMATSSLDPEADEMFPPHPEGTLNDTGSPSASSTAPRAVERADTRQKSPPSQSQAAASQQHGSFTINVPEHVHPFSAQQDSESTILTVQVSGKWQQSAMFYHNLLGKTNFGPMPQPHLKARWRAIVENLIIRDPAMFSSMSVMHDEFNHSPTDGVLSTWSINLEWDEYRVTGQWKCEDLTRSTGIVIEANKIFVADKNHEAAVVSVCRKKREEYRSVFEEDPTIAVPSINSRNDTSSRNGRAAEPANRSKAPSNDFIPLSTTAEPSPTMGGLHPSRSHQGCSTRVPAHDFNNEWALPRTGTQARLTEQQRTEALQKSVEGTLLPYSEVQQDTTRPTPPTDGVLGFLFPDPKAAFRSLSLPGYEELFDASGQFPTEFLNRLFDLSSAGSTRERRASSTSRHASPGVEMFRDTAGQTNAIAPPTARPTRAEALS
jgi:hypothetical protein